MTDEEQPDEERAAERREESEAVMPPDESNATIATPAEVAAAHPYRERFLVPFVFPFLIVIGVVFFVINISRLFLSTKGTGSVIIAAAVTCLILFGAAAMSAAPKMRTSSLTLIVSGSLVVILGAGWLTVGHAEEKKEAEVVLGPAVGETTINALATLKFQPSKVDLPFDPENPTQTVIQITLHDQQAGQHTLAFDDPTVIWTIPEVNAQGEKKTEKAGFPKAGDYEFHCTVPGHREAGMEGTMTITDSVKPQKVAGGTTETTTAG
jgi:plastocyanin